MQKISKKAKKIIIALSGVLSILILLIILCFTAFSLKTVKIDFRTSLENITLSEKEILESGKFKKGGSVFFHGKTSYKKNLENFNPYIKVVNIETVFPSTFVVHLVERQEVFAIAFEGGYYICDEELRVLRICLNENNDNETNDNNLSGNNNNENTIDDENTLDKENATKNEKLTDNGNLTVNEIEASIENENINDSETKNDNETNDETSEENEEAEKRDEYINTPQSPILFEPLEEEKAKMKKEYQVGQYITECQPSQIYNYLYENNRKLGEQKAMIESVKLTKDFDKESKKEGLTTTLKFFSGQTFKILNCDYGMKYKVGMMLSVFSQLYDFIGKGITQDGKVIVLTEENLKNCTIIVSNYYDTTKYGEKDCYFKIVVDETLEDSSSPEQPQLPDNPPSDK
ncbi:MAG: FtsQ-type POTRA domain-containing protein [Clostridia bacterium]|nr:FtsQ-type POTRA domain-containing protein [Clostridia bacterium]